MNELKLSNLSNRFPLDTPLEEYRPFRRWKINASLSAMKKYFIESMHDKKVIYCVQLNKPIVLSPTVQNNLQYLAQLSGYNEDLYVAAKQIISEENYDACVTKPQKLPKKDQDFIEIHGSRDHFSLYDRNFSGDYK